MVDCRKHQVASWDSERGCLNWSDPPTEADTPHGEGKACVDMWIEKSKVFAVMENGAMYESPDGISWTELGK